MLVSSLEQSRALKPTIRKCLGHSCSFVSRQRTARSLEILCVLAVQACAHFVFVRCIRFLFAGSEPGGSQEATGFEK